MATVGGRRGAGSWKDAEDSREMQRSGAGRGGAHFVREHPAQRRLECTSSARNSEWAGGSNDRRIAESLERHAWEFHLQPCVKLQLLRADKMHLYANNYSTAFPGDGQIPLYQTGRKESVLLNSKRLE